MLTRFFLETWSILLELAPWLFLGAVIATILKFTLPTDFVSRHLGRPNLGSVVKSSFLGLPMPLCSCGVIPAAISLKKSGASNGAVVSFMISTPQTGVDSLLIVASFLGWPLALFMMVTTFLTGILGGIFVHWFAPHDKGTESEAVSEKETCAVTPAASPRWQRYYRYAVDELIGGIYRYLLVGILVAAVINLVIPPNSLAGITALQGILGLLGVLLIAIPLYVCTNGSVPIAASLVASGLPAGSAFVFLMAGSATNVATLGSVFRVLGRRIMLIYLGTIIFSSLGLAWIFQALWGDFTLGHVIQHRHHEGSWYMQMLSTLSAVGLTALILRWSYLDLRSWFRSFSKLNKQAGLQEMVLHVEGMTCKNCVAHVKRDLEKVPGVARVEVDLSTGLAKMWGPSLNAVLLKAAVCKAGYAIHGETCA